MAKRTVNDPPPNAFEPTALEIRDALERVLDSRCFEHAGRASDFLRFVVGETLAGDGDRLKGYTIAIQVFGRPPSFDAQSDPLVRVEALRLRQRLTEYYAGEGAGDPVRLQLPRGSYAVKAVYATADAQPVDAAPLPPPPAQQRPLAAAFGFGTRARGAAGAAALCLAVAIGGAALRSWTEAPPSEPADWAAESVQRTKIAVVPLENFSDTPAFDRLAASLTEELMLRLDELDLYVVAIQSSWSRPGKALAGAEHGYVLTGSVRDHAGGARITLRITEAETGALIWSEAYDERPGIEDRPEVQAEVVRDAAAAAALFGPVFDAELALARRSAHSLELPDCQNRYRAFRRATDPALFPDALACFQSLVTRQPELAPAWAALAMLAMDEHVYYAGAADRGAALIRARAAVDMGLEADRTNVAANLALARFKFYTGDPDFPRAAERTVALDPNNPEVLGLLGILLTAYGDSTHGLQLVARAHELAPRPRPVFNLALVFAHLQDDEPCKALAEALELQADKWFIAHMITAAAAGACGDEAAAAGARERLLAAAPSFESDALGLMDLWRFEPRLRAAVLDGLRAAGLTLVERDGPSAPRASAATAADSPEL